MAEQLVEAFALEQLEQIGLPYLHILVAEPVRAYEVSWLLSNRGIGARVLRGLQMQRLDGLFNEVVAALQFPPYFGYNWAAFHECLSDLEWVAGTGYVVLITDALKLLAQEPVELQTLLSAVTLTAEEFAQPVALGEMWDRPAYPFHAVLQELPANVAELEARLASVEARYTILNRAWPSGDREDGEA